MRARGQGRSPRRAPHGSRYSRSWSAHAKQVSKWYHPGARRTAGEALVDFVRVPPGLNQSDGAARRQFEAAPHSPFALECPVNGRCVLEIDTYHPPQFLCRQDAPCLRPRHVNNRPRARLESIPSIERDPEWLVTMAIAANEEAAQFGKRRIEEAYGRRPSANHPGRAAYHFVTKNRDEVVECATFARRAREMRKHRGRRNVGDPALHREPSSRVGRLRRTRNLPGLAGTCRDLPGLAGRRRGLCREAQAAPPACAASRRAARLRAREQPPPGWAAAAPARLRGAPLVRAHAQTCGAPPPETAHDRSPADGAGHE